MFGNKKKNVELLVSVWLDDMQKARYSVNKTTEPGVFFTDYDIIKDLAGRLASISKYVKFKGTKPAEVLRTAVDQEQAAVRDLIVRCFQRAALSAEKLKTEKGKRSQFEKFQTSLEPYFFRMSYENVQLVQDLHDEALKKIGG